MSRFILAALAGVVLLVSGSTNAKTNAQPTPSMAVDTQTSLGILPGVAPFVPAQPTTVRCFGAVHSQDYCRTRILRQRIKLLRRVVWNRFAEHGNLRVRQERIHLQLPQLKVEYAYWRQKYRQAKRLPSGSLRFARWNNWICIHTHEGSWTDPNPPYYGGLQMDMSFQRTYGPEYLQRWGTANNWPPYVQVLVAERAYRSRGFTPWPNTARMCGLL